MKIRGPTAAITAACVLAAACSSRTSNEASTTATPESQFLHAVRTDHDQVVGKIFSDVKLNDAQLLREGHTACSEVESGSITPSGMAVDIQVDGQSVMSMEQATELQRLALQYLCPGIPNPG